MLENATLRGIVLGRDGQYYPSEINLDEHYGNRGGAFEVGGGSFSLSGKDFRLQQDPEAVKLVAELMDYGGVYRYAEIDLSKSIINQNGQLAFIK